MRYLTLLLILFSTSLPAQSSASETKNAAMADDVKAVLKKAGEAVNVDSLKDTKSMVQKANISIANMGIKGTITVYMKADKIRIESQTGNINEVNGFDGKTAWSENLTMGLRMLEGEEKLNLISETLPYAFTPEKFYDKIELEGKEVFNNVECYKVKFSKEGMDPTYEFYSTKDYISQGELRTIPSPMGKMKATTVYKEYKKHSMGFMYPSIMVQDMGPVKLEVKITEIKLNVKVEDKIFTLPAQ